MFGRSSLLILSLVLFTGCGAHRKSVDPAVLSDLSRSVHDRSPSSERPRQTASAEQYDPRGKAPDHKEDPPPPSVEQADHVTPAPTPGPTPAPTTPSEPSTPRVMRSEPPSPVPGPLPQLEPSTTPVVPVVRTTEPTEKKPEQAPRDPMVALFQCYRDGKSRDARQLLRELDPSSRDALALLMPLTVRLGELSRDSKPAEYSSTLKSLEELCDLLRPRASLVLEKMCYCRGSEKFGVYDPLPDDHPFHAAAEGRPGECVQVYVELRNFISQKSGQFNETVLGCTLEIVDTKSRVAWKQDRPAQVEQSRSRRRDGYLCCHFYVPPGLPAGDYTLWIHVRDVTGLGSEQVPAHRIARRSLPFRVRNGALVRAGG